MYRERLRSQRPKSAPFDVLEISDDETEHIAHKRSRKQTKNDKLDIPKKQKTLQTTTATLSESSLDSLPDGSADENEEVKCVICLEKPELQGALESCSHIFCFTCIQEWSKTSNTCPSCRNKFSKITKKDLKNPKKKFKSLSVQNVDQRVHYDEYYEDDEEDDYDSWDEYDTNDGFLYDGEDSEDELDADSNTLSEVWAAIWHNLAQRRGRNIRPSLIDLTAEDDDVTDMELAALRRNVGNNDISRPNPPRRFTQNTPRQVQSTNRVTRNNVVPSTLSRNTSRTTGIPSIGNILRPQLPPPLTFEELENENFQNRTRLLRVSRD